MKFYKDIVEGVKGFSRLDPAASRIQFRSDTEAYWPLSESMGKGYFSVVALRPGMVMAFTDHELLMPVQALYEFSGYFISFTYSIAGEFSMTSSSDGDPIYSYRNGYEILACIPVGEAFVELPVCEPVKSMGIYLDPAAFFDLFPDLENRLPPELNRFIKGDSQSTFYKEMPANVNVRMVLQEILTRNYKGPYLRMFLESKAIELMTHTLWRIRRQMLAESKGGLHPEETERVVNAKKIIDRHFCDDIKLLSLARQVGLPHPKLNRYFKDIYGTTVFGYIRELRINQARFLLSKGQANVTETAYAVGYSSLSHFSKIFKQHCGLGPGDFIRSTVERSG